MEFKAWHLKGLSLVAALVLWEVIGRLTSPMFFSTPIRTFVALADMASSGNLISNLMITLRTFLIGLSISVTVGIAIGILVGYFRKVRMAVDHFVVALYSTPYIVWTPLIILWLGIGELARVAVVILAAVWPMIINIMYGITYAEESLLEVGKVFGCTSRQLVSKVVLPGSVPFIAAGFRLSVGRALVGALVAEMFLQLVGLGGSLLRYTDLLQSDKVLALILVTMILGIGLAELGKLLEARAAAWKVTD